jgi:hypothetical protein
MHGKPFYMVSVAALVLALVFSIALPGEAAMSAKEFEEAVISAKELEEEIAGETPDGEVPAQQQEEIESRTHLGECILCYTCASPPHGLPWRVRRAVLSVPSGLATREWSYGCTGVIRPIHDPNPFLCCTR